MNTGLSTDYGDLIAQRIRAAHKEIAGRWLDRLADRLPVDENDVFPTDELLDHIPALISEIADYVGAGTPQAIGANTTLFTKARELGELRFSQKASVHQLLREYRLLSGVLGAFVREQFTELALPLTFDNAEVAAVLNRLNEAVFVLMEITVDTFVGRYTAKIDDQTSRLDGFTRMVSHELRQPLVAIQYAVQLLREPASLAEDKRTHFLEVADRNVQRLSYLLGMLAALAHPEPDNPRLQPADLSKVVAEALRQLRDAAEAKGVTLRSRVDPLILTLDVARLELVLVNLVSNAIKYRDPSKACPTVEVSLQRDADRYRLQVEDNGLGIPERDRSRIFQRFARLHADRDRELGNDGVGLGLTIAAECARALGATLTFESIETAGTTFVLSFSADRSEGVSLQRECP